MHARERRLFGKGPKHPTPLGSPSAGSTPTKFTQDDQHPQEERDLAVITPPIEKPESVQAEPVEVWPEDTLDLEDLP